MLAVKTLISMGNPGCGVNLCGTGQLRTYNVGLCPSAGVRAHMVLWPDCGVVVILVYMCLLLVASLLRVLFYV
jgi:hypothetical protein